MGLSKCVFYLFIEKLTLLVTSVGVYRYVRVVFCTVSDGVSLQDEPSAVTFIHSPLHHCDSYCTVWAYLVHKTAAGSDRCERAMRVSMNHLLSRITEDVRFCPLDRGGCSNGQTRPEESSDRPADGWAEVPEESSPKTRLRQSFWRHRDERAGRLRNQQVGRNTRL